MSDVDVLLDALRKLNATVRVEEGRLHVTVARGTLPPDLRAQLSQRKEEVIAALAGQADRGVVRAPRDRALPMSFGQQRLWFLTRMSPDVAIFNTQLSPRIQGPFDETAMRRALAALVERHEVLRTRLTLQDGEPVQIVDPPFEPVASAERVDGDSLAARESAAIRLAREEIARPFALDREPPFRARIFRLDDGDHVVLLTIHHSAVDGWSFAVLQRDLSVLYRAFAAGEPSPLEPLPVQYADFAAWQRASLTDDVLARERAYWIGQLAGLDPALEIPGDRPRPAIQSNRGRAITRPMPLMQAARALSRRLRATPFMTVLAAWSVVLSRFSGRRDLAIGTPVTNRGRRELDDLIGFFVNSLVLRVDLDGDPTFADLVDRIRRTTLDGHAHQHMPFERLVEELRPGRDLSRHPVFQMEFVLHAAAPSVELPGLSRLSSGDDAAPAAPVDRATALDLGLEITDSEERPRLMLGYNADVFDDATCMRLLNYFELVLSAVADDPTRRVSQLSAITDEDARQIDRWNETGRPYEQHACLHELVSAQAARTPEAVAVETAAERMTYSELEARAGRVAARLREKGVGSGARVGVYMERSADLVCALVGILKAGAAYIPLDPAFPADRIAYMVADSNAAAVVVDRPSSASLPPSDSPVLFIDDLQRGEGRSSGAAAAAGPEDVAYVIYTSGSTGRPKGVQVPHRGVVNFLASMRETPGLSASDRLLAVTTLSFDIAGLELFLPLTTGATVVLARREEAADPLRLMDLLRERRVTVMQATPATWRMLLDAGWKGSPALRVFCGGEAMPDDLARALCSRCESVWNLYGPTETTIWSTVERVTPGSPVTIGRPIANTRILVVDEGLRPVPIGAAGEICIAGDGVARGYLGRPELTAEKFVSDPTGTAGARMYRTGDLGRYRNDGRLQYLGRIDHQVKLRGFRIELGEIEAVLASHPGVARVVGRVREDVPGDARLVAYVVPGESGPSTSLGPGPSTSLGPGPGLIDDLRQLVAEKLPTYMHPSAYVVLDALPLTPNGKVDRAALPAPERSAPAAEAIAPSTDAEERIAAVWREVLRLDDVGVNHSFFDLGGHSLLLVQVQSRLSASFGRPVAILDLFQYPTIAALARHLGGGEPKAATTFADEAAARTRRRPADEHGAAIAIVGLAGRFPGSADVDAFWQNLRNGVEGVRFFSDDELTAAGVPAAVMQQPNYVKARGVLDGADLFDAALFGFTPREADLMDPQQRVFLECAWEALERAGYDPQRYAGPIGVFAGASLSGYVIRAILSGAFGGNEVEMLLNGDKDHLPTRVSYKLNLRGPSVNVQTACSTSLVAVHLACRSLIDHECDMALAGGVSVGPQVAGYSFVEGSILSPDGHCRTFDAKARGTVGGSGAGIVVLKRLADALADGDHIHAVLLGTGINNDGSAKIGYTAPSVDGESKAIALAQAVAGCSGDSISYVEAHGTGTALGDPIEIKALTQVFREATPARGYCAIGSVKSNIGHLDAAAGVAGLIKTALALEHREIPPSLHFESPNPEIDFADSPFFVNTTLRPWETPAGVPRRAAISSFGLGGTNAHAVLEEAPEGAPSGPSREWQLLPVAARSETALDLLSDRLAGALAPDGGTGFADACYTLAVGRQPLEHRRVVIARTPADAAAGLQSRSGARVVSGRVRQAARVAFLFPGQGAQYLGRGADLYRAEDVFRREVDACADAFRAAIDVDVREILCSAAGDGAERLQGTTVTQAALFTLEYSLARLWMSWGVVPTAMLGHSIGEYVAAAISGVLTLSDAVALVARRARLMEAAPAGAMLAVSAPIASLRSLDLPGVSVAAVNGPAQCVLSGARDAVDRAAEELSARGIDTRPLQTAGAFHSALMDGVVAPLTETARGVRCGRPRIPYVSNLSGRWIGESDVTADYWARHLRGTVEFQAGVETLIAAGTDVLLEVGPGQTLGALARQICTQHDHRAEVFASLPRAGATASDREHIASTVGRLWVTGVPVDWAGYYSGERRRRVVLPAYPFERKRHWIDAVPVAAPSEAAAGPPAKDPDLSNWFFTPEWQSQPNAAFDPESVRSAGPWMVFADDTGLAHRLAARVTACGTSAIVVDVGETFERTGDGYRLAPGRPDHFDALVADLQREGRIPGAMLHVWAFGASALEPNALVDRAYTSLVQYVRASGAIGVDLPRVFGVVTSGAHRVTGAEPVSPEVATSVGPVLVLPVEHEGVRCRAVDLAADEWTVPNAEREHTLLATVLEQSGARFAAIRGRRTWGRAFHQQRVEGYAGGLRFKPNGVYLITGGYGGIGLELAEYLADTCAARLVLTGREGLPDRGEWAKLREQSDPRLTRRIESVEALEARGAQVLTVAADAADEAAMRRVVAMALERFGAIDGVIHAAGIPGARIMQLDDGHDSASVLAPKVAGTRILFRALESARPDFVVLCSSINTVSGAMGQAAYTAANAYLDAVAHAAPESGPEVLAINWDPWQEVGMAVNTVVPERMARARREELKQGILPAEGREAFVRLLHAHVGPQVIVSTRDFRPRRAVRPASAPASTAERDTTVRPAGHERPALSQPYVAPRNPIEEEVAAVWARLFGMAQVGVDDDFFELGGHSLLATQVMSRLREQFQVNLPLAVLFEAPTVAGLSLAVMERLMEAEPRVVPQAS